MIDVKVQRWHEISEQVGRMTDALGLPIDPGIHETVVALNALGVHTFASCEGHLERGMAAPWIEIAAPDMRPQEKLAFARQLQAEQARARGLPDEQCRQLLADAAQMQAGVRAAHLQVCARLLDYLAQFYRQYPMDYGRHLVLNFADWLGKGRLQSLGASFQELRTPDERVRMLAIYQQEMTVFTGFLKRVYFAGKEGDGSWQKS